MKRCSWSQMEMEMSEEEEEEQKVEVRIDWTQSGTINYPHNDYL